MSAAADCTDHALAQAFMQALGARPSTSMEGVDSLSLTFNEAERSGGFPWSLTVGDITISTTVLDVPLRLRTISFPARKPQAIAFHGDQCAVYTYGSVVQGRPDMLEGMLCGASHRESRSLEEEFRGSAAYANAAVELRASPPEIPPAWEADLLAALDEVSRAQPYRVSGGAMTFEQGCNPTIGRESPGLTALIPGRTQPDGTALLRTRRAAYLMNVTVTTAGPLRIREVAPIGPRSNAALRHQIVRAGTELDLTRRRLIDESAYQARVSRIFRDHGPAPAKIARLTA